MQQPGPGAKQVHQVFKAQRPLAGAPDLDRGRAGRLQPGGGAGGKVEVGDDHFVVSGELQGQGGQVISLGRAGAEADFIRRQAVSARCLLFKRPPLGLVQDTAIHAQQLILGVLRQRIDHDGGRNALGRGVQIGLADQGREVGLA